MNCASSWSIAKVKKILASRSTLKLPKPLLMQMRGIAGDTNKYHQLRIAM